MIEVRVMEAGDMENFQTNFDRIPVQDWIFATTAERVTGAAVVATDEGRVVGMGGLVEIDGNSHAWLAAAPALIKRPVFLYRALKYAVDALMADYGPIYATVGFADAGTQRLCRMLGFAAVGERDGDIVMERVI